MSTHNICFHGEIRKISTFLGEKSALSVAVGLVWLGVHCLHRPVGKYSTLDQPRFLCVLILFFASIYFKYSL